ncbi:hypothetical protein SAMN05444004_10837 [Jannaschia faecimaris]|uniref:Uncharacterized protein n=1 Tax=Jannaschia faecimaris TaxID=1244108 RepID=A0A1H3RAH2_9RHOB|nr:hypothetical protein [Jannaschia faecimaris]SDZ22754.1 hypothetical protein SAMN05444004_10837 [Jannaschia faecimaris]
MNDYTLDMIAIETRARSLRAAYVREALTNLMARLRGTRATGNAHA